MALKKKQPIEKIELKKDDGVKAYKRSFPKASVLLTKQIAVDLTNDRLFLICASWCNSNGFKNTAKYFFRKSNRSRESAIDLIKLLQDYSIEVTVPSAGDISLPDTLNIEAITQLNVNTEIETTDGINDLYFAAHEDKAAILIPYIFELLERQKKTEKLAIRMVSNLAAADNEEDFEEKIEELS